MSLGAEEIAQVVAELQPLVGGTVQKIYAPTPRAAILELRVPGATHQLLVSAEPDETRLHRATARHRLGHLALRTAKRTYEARGAQSFSFR